MVGHINLCLDEIEAEVAATGFSVIGARSRELIAQHIAGIRYIVEADDGLEVLAGNSEAIVERARRALHLGSQLLDQGLAHLLDLGGDLWS